MLALSLRSAIAQSLFVFAQAQTYKASFTEYGSGDQNASGNCNVATTACGFFTNPGFSVAVSQNLFGVGSGAGAGPACGTCYKLTIETDTTGKQVANAGKSIVVKVTNLCPIEGNPPCSQQTLTDTNPWGANVNFDLCINSGASGLFDGSGTQAAMGNATLVDCSQWTGTDVGTEPNVSGSSNAGSSVAASPSASSAAPAPPASSASAPSPPSPYVASSIASTTLSQEAPVAASSVVESSLVSTSSIFSTSTVLATSTITTSSATLSGTTITESAAAAAAGGSTITESVAGAASGSTITEAVAGAAGASTITESVAGAAAGSTITEAVAGAAGASTITESVAGAAAASTITESVAGVAAASGASNGTSVSAASAGSTVTISAGAISNPTAAGSAEASGETAPLAPLQGNSTAAVSGIAAPSISSTDSIPALFTGLATKVDGARQGGLVAAALALLIGAL